MAINLATRLDRQQPAPPPCARDIMTKDPITVRVTTTVMEAAGLMLERKVSNTPVVEPDFTRNMLRGFISEKDVMQAYASGRLHAEPLLKVADIMRPFPVSVRPETDLYALAAVFMQHGYRHLPVTVGGALQGLVSRRDVLNGLIEDFRAWQFQDPATRKVPDMSGIFTPRYLLG